MIKTSKYQDSTLKDFFPKYVSASVTHHMLIPHYQTTSTIFSFISNFRFDFDL